MVTTSNEATEPGSPLRTVKRDVILALLGILGHDPHKVTQITIHPGYIIVEYTHPILDGPVEPIKHDVED